ncbi:MAG TPA: type II secretion system F family protein [Gemmatimonadales bacterium]
MAFLIAALVSLAVIGVVMLVVQLAPSQPDALRRLQEMPFDTGMRSTLERRRREERSEQLRKLLETLGTRVEGGRDLPQSRRLLMTAGYMAPGAVQMFFGARMALAAILALASLSLAPVLQIPVAFAAFAALWGALLGWVLPVFIVRARAKSRQKEMIKAMPDALDLLVVCVEAGLGLNQALVKVAEEIANISPVLGEQFGLVNLEIRAGTPREEALRNLGERTDVEDIRSFATMLIQTDRFGTSVANALRVHADTLRVKRRQRAEEASAKTPIKMLFPLVFFIFPAMFVVILGPALLQIAEAMQQFR